MKTTEIANGKNDPENNGLTTDKSAIRQAIELKANSEVKVLDTKTAIEQTPNQEPSKKELKEQIKVHKPVLNLDETIKLALDLTRRINQRDRLLKTVNNLESFEITQNEDAEDTNVYQGCELTIEDDKGREFTTKNTFIISEVAKMVNRLCVDKLAEIEGGICIPEA